MGSHAPRTPTARPMPEALAGRRLGIRNYLGAPAGPTGGALIHELDSALGRGTRSFRQPGWAGRRCPRPAVPLWVAPTRARAVPVQHPPIRAVAGPARPCPGQPAGHDDL